MNDINRRIDTIITELNLTNKEFGKSLGVTEATARNLRKNSVVKDIYIETISNKWNYSEEWIRSGEGSMLKEDSTDFSTLSTSSLLEHLVDNTEELIKLKTFRNYIRMTMELIMTDEEREKKNEALKKLKEEIAKKYQGKDV
ncbi:hypothetical protein ACFSTE_21130 [Aquimarina hainanensis]|uniref:XRE family transcriptional regulator n=1 Tax=Aquimarina hainanensis TaxID=1578017 RepID=A0ABW5NDC8_9FLAO